MLLSGGLLRLSIPADTNGNIMDCEVPYSALQSYKIFFIKRNSHSGLTHPNRRGYRQPERKKGGTRAGYRPCMKYMKRISISPD